MFWRDSSTERVGFLGIRHKIVTEFGLLQGLSLAQAVSRRPVTAGDRVPSQAIFCDIFGGQTGLGIGFSPSTSVFPSQYNSTIAPYTFIHLPPTLYNVSLPVLQVSPVSTIPPMLHTHSFTYHPRYIMFLSQYFCFPQSVPFHQHSTPIFIFVLFLSPGQADEVWKPSNTILLFLISWKHFDISLIYRLAQQLSAV